MAGFAPGKRSQLSLGLPNPEDFGGRYRVILPSLATILDMDNNEIGFVREVTPSFNRRVEPVRHLNYVDGGRIVQMAWGPMDPIGLTLRGFALYTENLLDPGTTLGRLVTKNTGIPVIHIVAANRIPFNVLMDFVHPYTAKGLRIMFGECVVSRYGYSVRVDDTSLTDEVTCSCAYLEEMPAVGYEPVPNPPG